MKENAIIIDGVKHTLTEKPYLPKCMDCSLDHLCHATALCELFVKDARHYIFESEQKNFLENFWK